MTFKLDTAGLVERLRPSAVIDHVPGMAVSNLRRCGSDDIADRLNDWIVRNNDLKREAADLIEAAEARVAELTEALTPSADTKADYIGEFKFSIDDIGLDEDGEPFECRREVTVPWTTIKEIMAAIRSRAALAHKGEGR